MAPERLTIFFEDRGRQPLTIYCCTQQYRGVAALGSGRSPDEAGGQLSGFSRAFNVRGGTGAVPSLVPL